MSNWYRADGRSQIVCNFNTKLLRWKYGLQYSKAP